MSILLVLCDAADAECLERAFEEYGEAFRLSRSSYLIRSDKHHDETLSQLRTLPCLIRPDSLFVIRVQQPYIGPVSADVNRWLRRRAEQSAAEHDDTTSQDST